MSEFLKKLGASLYQRVVLSYKSTLVGFGLAAAVIVVDQSTEALKAMPQSWAQLIAAVLAIGGSMLKAKALAAPPPPAP